MELLLESEKQALVGLINEKIDQIKTSTFDLEVKESLITNWNTIKTKVNNSKTIKDMCNCHGIILD